MISLNSVFFLEPSSLQIFEDVELYPTDLLHLHLPLCSQVSILSIFLKTLMSVIVKTG